MISPEKIRRRVARITTDDLLMWADNAASGIQRQLDDFRREPDEAHLGEIKLAALSLDAVTDELALRMKQARELIDSGDHNE
jgi:hypothetical protein